LPIGLWLGFTWSSFNPQKLRSLRLWNKCHISWTATERRQKKNHRNFNPLTLKIKVISAKICRDLWKLTHQIVIILSYLKDNLIFFRHNVTIVKFVQFFSCTFYFNNHPVEKSKTDQLSTPVKFITTGLWWCIYLPSGFESDMDNLHLTSLVCHSFIPSSRSYHLNMIFCAKVISFGMTLKWKFIVVSKTLNGNLNLSKTNQLLQPFDSNEDT